MTSIRNLHRRWRKDADYKRAHDALGEAFDLARSLIDTRAMVRLPPPQHAKKLKSPGRASRELTRKRASLD